MKSKMLSALLVLTFATAPLAHAGSRDVVGGFIGGLFGGVLCDKLGIGNGSGRVAAIAFCAVGGAMVGQEIGRDMEEADRRAFEESQRRSFEGDLNRDYDWNGNRYGSRSGVYGRMRPIRHGYNRNTREVCREYESVTHRGNRTSKTHTLVCKRSDGSFYSLEEKNLFIDGYVVERRVEEEGRGSRVPAPYVVPDGRGGRDSRDDRYRGRDDRRDRDRRYDDRRDERRDPRRGNVRCEGWNQNDLRMGDAVYTRRLEAGSFEGFTVGRNPEATVRMGRSIQNVRFDGLALSGCHFGIRTGEWMATRYGSQVRILGVFSNGDLAVDSGSRLQVLRQDDLYRR